MQSEDQNQLIQKKIQEVANLVPSNKRHEATKKLKSVFQTISVQSSYSGPIPHPSILKELNEVIPNGAQWVLKQAEKNAEHRQTMEKYVAKRAFNQSGIGIWLAFIVVLVLVSSASYLAITGKENVAITIFSITIVAVAGVFISGKINKQKKVIDA